MSLEVVSPVEASEANVAKEPAAGSVMGPGVPGQLIRTGEARITARGGAFVGLHPSVDPGKQYTQ